MVLQYILVYVAPAISCASRQMPKTGHKKLVAL
jgi:hypothetical protein